MARRRQSVILHLEYLYAASFCMVSRPQVSQRIAERLVWIAKKHQVRLSVDMKRSICTGCHVVLVPLVTSDTAIRRDADGLGLVVQCRLCGRTRRFVMRGERGLRKRRPARPALPRHPQSAEACRPPAPC